MGENFKALMDWLKSPGLVLNGPTRLTTGRHADKLLENERLEKTKNIENKRELLK